MQRHLYDQKLSGGSVVVLIVVLVLCYQLLSLVQIPDGPSLVVTQGATQQFQCNDPTKPLTEWQEVTFPHWERGIEEKFHCMRMRTTLPREQLSVDRGPTKLMLSAWSGLGQVSLNGEIIDKTIHATAEQRVYWFRPYSVVVPTHLVEDSNVLEFNYFSYQPVFGIGQLRIGDEPQIEDRMHLISFFTKWTFDGLTIMAGFIGAFLTSFSILYPRERLIGLAGRAIFVWSVLFQLLMMVEVPSSYFVAWQAIQFGLFSWVLFWSVDFIRVISEVKSDPLFTHARTVFGLAGMVACLMFGEGSIEPIKLYWASGMILYYAAALTHCFIQKNLLKKAEGKLLIVHGSVVLVLTGHGFLINTGTMEPVWKAGSAFIPPMLVEEIYVMHFEIITMLVVMSLIVLNRYRIAQSYLHDEANRIRKALQLSENRLRDVMQKQQDLNNIRLIQSERERLLMEIHDGVGSQLISGMLLAKKQDLSHETMLDMFQTCMDDVKVIIDCISLGQPANAAVMIGTLLDRQRQRLAGLGMSLNFIADQKKNASLLEISDAQCLHASRIVQECIANAIKYAQCSMITVSLRQYQDHLLIVVRDNGTGLAPAETIKLGRGLMNMRKRARLLSGQIRFLSKEDGFRVMLRFKNTTIEDFMQAA